MIDFPHEILDLGRDGIAAELVTVPDSTTLFDSQGQRFAPVPGFKQAQYALWGEDNRRPYDLRTLIEADEVTAQNKLFNVQTCYGAGIRFRPLGGSSPQDEVAEEVTDWAFAQNLPRYFLEQITDMKYYFFSVCVVILSKDGRRINRLLHKDAASCRFARAGASGRIDTVYFKDWAAQTTARPEALPLLSETDPLGDLRHRLRLVATPQGKQQPATAHRKFAIVCRFPMVTNPYYPTPYYASIFRGGSYDEKRLISVGKRAKLRNSSSVKYLIEVSQDYWRRILETERISDPIKQRERIKKEKENMRNFMLGLHNSGKAWISNFYVNPKDGKAYSDVRIVNIETAKEGGDWAEDLNVAANTLCYADNIHPNLIGATPGKSQMNNSGSDKRELFTMKQRLEKSYHDLLLRPLEVVCRFNGWAARPFVPIIELTTLDTHKSSQLLAP